MRGHISKRERRLKNGRSSILYYAVVYRGPDPVTGTKRYDWGSGHRTRKGAERALTARLTEMQGGVFVPSSSSLTLRAYLVDTWLPTTKARVKATTLAGYAWSAHHYLLPALGNVRLQDLTVSQVNALYAQMLTGDVPGQTKQGGGQGRALSNKSVRNLHGLLRKVLADAVDDGLLSRNVAAKARPPRATPPEISPWAAPELQAFLASAQGDRLVAAWHLAAVTGMRRGELLGLRWEDFDLDHNRLAVRQTLVSVSGVPTISTPKSRSPRTVDLDEDTIAVLRAHRRRQAEERLAYGPGYVDLGLVVRKDNGEPLHPDVFSTAFDRLVARAGIRRIRLHDLRHTHATLLLKAGVPVKVVSERLGHASPAFTMTVYQHVLPGMQAEAAAAMAAILRQAPPRGSEAGGRGS